MNGRCNNCRLYCKEWIQETALKKLLNNEWLLGSVGEIRKSVDEYKNDKLRRISAGAEKKRKIKQFKLKHKHKGSKNRKEKKRQNVKKAENGQEAIPEVDECKSRTIPSGIQEKSNDSSDSTNAVAKKLKIKNVKKHAKCSESSSSKGSTQINKFKKEGKKGNKKLEEKAGAETSDKDKAKRTIIKQKGTNKSSKDSGSISEEGNRKKKKIRGNTDGNVSTHAKSVKSSRKTEVRNVPVMEKDKSASERESINIRESEKNEIRKKSKIKKGKRRKLSEDFYECEKIRGDKKKAKKRKSISKSISGQDKKEKRKVKKVKDQRSRQKNKNFIGKNESEISDKKIKTGREVEKLNRMGAILTSESEKESKKTEDEEKLNSGRKSEIKPLEDQGKQAKISDSVTITKRSTSTSTATENEIPDECTDEKTGSISEEKEEEQEGAILIRKQPEEKMEIRPKQDDVKTNEIPGSDEIHGGKRKIMRVFMQKKNNLDSMAVTSKRMQYEMNKTQKTNSDTTITTHGPAEMDDLSSSTGVAEATRNKTDEEKMMNDDSSSNVATSNEQNMNFRISDGELERSNEFKKELEYMKDNEKDVAMNASPTNTNTDIEQNEQNQSSDRSYINGLAQIQTIVEIYGAEKEKTEAFNKLLDEDLSLNQKEIGENLMKAVCDLPMNTELLQKVLEKMRCSGLLQKKEYEMLQKNLVPQAVNETVTIALLAQVLQRKKHKKLTS